MGKGNWRPELPARGWNEDTFQGVLYVDLLDLMSEITPEDFQIEEAYDVLKDVIGGILPESFSKTEDRQSSDWFGGRGFGRDTRALFHNDHTIVCWDTDGEWHHQGIGVVVNPMAYYSGRVFSGFAETSSARIFSLVRTGLLLAYPKLVSARTSAWTSGPIPPPDLSKLSPFETKHLSKCFDLTRVVT